MKICLHGFYFIPIFLLIETFHKVGGIYVEKVVVPPVAIAGQTVKLQCLYREENDELYSLKWWRGEDHFYQYIPPKRSFYSIPGVRVNMSATQSENKADQSGLEVVVLDAVGLDTAGVFKCEVMADKIFQTVYKGANMTVVYPPSGPPSIAGASSKDTIMKGQRVSLMCSVPPANPPPRVLWRINNNFIDNKDWVTDHPSLYGGGLSQVVSSLDFQVTEQILDQSEDGLHVECETRQPESSYHERVKVIFFPERSSYFWFFSGGEMWHPSEIAVLRSVVLIEILRYFY